MFGERILKDWDQIEQDLAALVAIPSVKGEERPGKPFGEESARALEFILRRAEEMGLKTENTGNYAGHASWGCGEEYDAVLAHVDVVPAGTGWKTDPFTLTEQDGLWFGRGVADDKGPAVVALYCLKALKDAGITGKREMRVIFGAGEEHGMEDLEQYFSAHPLPRAAFTPDSEYTVCNREKGILQFEFSSPKIARFAVSGGEAVNAVVGKASASLPNDYELAARLRKLAPTSPCGVSVMETCGEINLIVSGAAAHAMEPHKGNNAATALLQLLKNAMGSTGSAVCDFVAEKIGRELDGASLGVKCEDEPSGGLTLNVGYLKTDHDAIRIGCDIRYPVTKNGEELIAALRAAAEQAGVSCRILHHAKPLYLPPESSLVQLLCGAYEDVTGEKALVYATGGGTYARALQGRGVAFGAEFTGGKSGGMHTAGEHCDPEELRRHAVICLEAMYRRMTQE